MNKLIYIVTGFIMAANLSYASIELNYGEGFGKVGFINSSNCPNVEELEADGPGSFRIVNGKFFIADSIGGKIIVTDEKGKVEKEFPVVSSGEFKRKPDFEGDPCLQSLIVDICPIKGQYGDFDGMWAADALHDRLIKFDKNGVILQTIANDEFVQIDKIEAGANGHLFVSDAGADKIFIFDKDGNMVGDEIWEGNGLAVSGMSENLSRLRYSEENEALFMVTSNLGDALVREVLIDIPDIISPELWWVDEENKYFVISYATNDLIGEDGTLPKLKVAKINFDGKIIQTGEIDAASSMNRFIEHDNYEKMYIGKCNFDAAPNGSFAIVPFEFDKVDKH